ncbi:MAG: hypothetical protein V4489_08090 [Chlamydiota bacterium]
MESSSFMKSDVKLQIAFPKSKEDHRLQLVEVNGSIFAILHSPLESLGPIRLYCEEWSLVLLAPINSKTNILISAKNIICLNEITSEEGNVSIHASNRLVKFAHSIKPSEKICEMGEQGESQFNDDPGALLCYYQLFDAIVNSLHSGSTDSFSEAQQKFIMSLCALADKIVGGSENLNLQKVLDIWNIPYLKS